MLQQNSFHSCLQLSQQKITCLGLLTCFNTDTNANY